MNISVRGFWVAVVLWVAATRAGAEDFTNAVRAYLRDRIEVQNIHGCLVVGMVDEQGTRVVSYGGLDNGTGRQADGDSVFAVHSMTVLFTRMLLQDMVARGEMQADDPAAKYLPKSMTLPTRNGKEITLRDLAKEASGLPYYADVMVSKRADDPMADYTVEKMDAFVSGAKLTSDPGKTHAHAGLDLGLLGQAMELTSGTNYETLMATRIFGPLGMASSGFTLTPEIKTRLASEHDYWGFGYAIPQWNWGVLKPLAGGYSTANDLLKLASAMGLKPGSMTPIIEGAVMELGFERPPGLMIHAGGGGRGGSAYVSFDKGRHRGVVILSTGDDLRLELGNYLQGCEWQTERRPTGTMLESKAYEAYVGEYRLMSDKPRTKPSAGGPAEIEIRREGDRLFAEQTGLNPGPRGELLLPPLGGELVAESKGNFFERLSGRPVTFLRSGWGKVTGLSVELDGQVFAYEKISDRPPKGPQAVPTFGVVVLDAKQLEACVGDYVFAPDADYPAGMKLKVWREGDHLAAEAWGEKVLTGVFDLYPLSSRNFFDKFFYHRLDFVKNDGGRVTGVVHRQGGQADLAGRKVK